MKQRPSAGNTIPEPKLMKASFAGKCRCGKTIRPGDQIFFEKRRKAMCYACGTKESKMAKAGLTPVEKPFGAQRLIDRFRAIDSLPRPLSKDIREEFLAVMREMCTTMAHDREIQQFIRTKANCDKGEADLRPFQLQYERACVDCGKSLRKGRLAFCDFNTRNIHCAYCDFAKHFIETET